MTVVQVVLSQFSRILGIAVIGAACLLKIPQLNMVYRAKSVYGISLSAILYETLAYLLHTLYNIAFGYAYHTWFEAAAIGLQNVILLFMFSTYSKHPSVGQLLAGIFGTAAFSIAYIYLLPTSVQVALQVLQSPISLYSRVPQIIQNHTHRTTGQLNFTTYFLKFVGTLARVFTSIVSVGDVIIIATAVLSAALNGALVAQFYMYPPATKQTPSTPPRPTFSSADNARTVPDVADPSDDDDAHPNLPSRNPVASVGSAILSSAVPMHKYTAFGHSAPLGSVAPQHAAPAGMPTQAAPHPPPSYGEAPPRYPQYATSHLPPAAGGAAAPASAMQLHTAGPGDGARGAAAPSSIYV